MSTADRPTLRLTREIPGTTHAVYEAFTDPALLGKWFGPEVLGGDVRRLDVCVGGGYEVAMEGKAGTPMEGETFVVKGAYMEVVPRERLVFTWAWESPEWEGEESVVAIGLAQEGANVALSLEHTGLLDEECRADHLEGWNATLTRLERLVGLL